MSVAVKMRQSLKKGSGGDDGGRSSSGNWSASSSTRASVDSSDQQPQPSSNDAGTPTDSSIDKDSMLSDTQDTESRFQDFTSDTSTLTAGNSKSQRPSSLGLSSIQTNNWVKSLDPASNASSSTQENYFSDTSTPLVRSPYTRRKAPSNGDPSPPNLDDEESSVYSIDTDGYYTSMHTDSGLKTKTVQSPPEGDTFRNRKDSISSVSTLGNVSLNSLLSRTATEISSRSNSLTRDKKRPPPPPPQRVSSIKRSVAKETSPMQDVSESETESRERLRQKTSINPSRYPSMCALSPEPTSDEDEGLKESTAKSSANSDGEDLNATSDSMNSLESARFINNENKELDKSSNSQNSAPCNGSKDPPSSVSKTNIPSKKARENNPARNTVIFIPDAQLKKDHQSETKNKSNFEVRMPNLTDFSRLGKDNVKDVNNSFRERLSSDSSSTSSTPSSSSSKSDSSPILPPPMPLVDAVYKSPGASSSGYSFNYPSLMRRDHQNLGRPKFANLPERSSSLLRHNDHSASKSTHPPNSTMPNNSNKQVARVTLDPSGKVIFSSNSLGRRRDGHPLNYPNSSSATSNSEAKFATLPLSSNNPCPTRTSAVTAAPNSTRCLTPTFFQRNMPNRSTLPKNFPSALHAHHNPSTKVLSSTAHNPYLNSLHMINKQSNQRGNNSIPQSTPTSNGPIPTSIASPNYGQFLSLSRSTTSTPTFPQRSFTPEPNGRPHFFSFSKQEMLNRPSPNPGINNHGFQTNAVTNTNSCSNVALPRPLHSPHHYKQQQHFTPPSTPSTPSPSTHSSKVIYSPARSEEQRPNSSSPSFQYSKPQLSSPCQMETPSSCKVIQSSSPNHSPPKSNGTPPKKTMSSADLFAIIHNSKKKHNIRTDLDQSISPHSSRSSSPPSSLGRPATPNKNGLAETGFLTPRNDQLPSQKRRSWVGDASPSLFTPGERRSLAADRLGPAKPTSIHDFKMLLLQAKTATSPASGISAAERLKSNSAQAKRSDSPVVSNPSSPQRQGPSPPHQNAAPRVNGHTTVPLKRNARTKYCMQTRRDLTCEPIYEDHREEDGGAQRTNSKSPVSFLSAPANTSAIRASTWV